MILQLRFPWAPAETTSEPRCAWRAEMALLHQLFDDRLARSEQRDEAARARLEDQLAYVRMRLRGPRAPGRSRRPASSAAPQRRAEAMGAMTLIVETTMTDERKFRDLVQAAVERHGPMPPAWLATQVLADIGFTRDIHEVGYLAAHLTVEQIARKVLGLPDLEQEPSPDPERDRRQAKAACGPAGGTPLMHARRVARS